MKASRSWSIQRARSAALFAAPASSAQAGCAIPSFRTSLMSALCFGLASTVCFAESSSTVTTITSPPLLPLVAPNGPPVKATFHYGRTGGLLIDWATSAWARQEQARRFSTATAEGLAAARQSGQKGVLLQVRYTQTRDFNGKQVISPVGDGVIVVGAGPDANAVCYLQDCGHSLSPAPNINAATTWTKDSGYYWLELKPPTPRKSGEATRAPAAPTQEVLSISRYDTAALQSRTLQLRMTEDAGYAYGESVNSTVLHDVLKSLEHEASSREELAEITKLRDAQNQMREKQVELETALTQELKRQSERAQASAGLAVLGDVLSVGGAALTADPGSDARSGQAIAKLNGELKGLRKQLSDLRGDVSKLAKQHRKTVPRLRGVPPPVVVRPLPLPLPMQAPVPINQPR